MTARDIDSVTFERLLSHKPSLSNRLAFDQPSLRDMVFEFYTAKYPGAPETANEAMKEYLDALWGKFGRKDSPSGLNCEAHFYRMHTLDPDVKVRKKGYFRDAAEFHANIKVWNESTRVSGHGYFYEAIDPIETCPCGATPVPYAPAQA